jgi:Zn-finger domain-containing protein
MYLLGMNIQKLVRRALNENFFDSPLHQQLAKKAEEEKHKYKHELRSYEDDHKQHMTVHERRQLLGRVSLGLDQSKRGASDFEKKLESLLKEYGL